MKKRMTAAVLALVLVLGIALPAAALTLRFKDEGPEVALLQWKLQELNYYKGAIDGKYGYDLVLAVSAYQKNNGLKVDGVAGPQTLGALGDAAPGGKPANAGAVRRIAYGSTGDDVISIQNRLKDLGYFSGTVDGKFRDSTFRAVVDFQRVSHLTKDGIVGPVTWNRLFGKSAISKSASSSSAVLRLNYRDSGEDVAKVQQRLKELKYFTKTVDGTYCYYTYQTVRSFQKLNGLKVDGVVGRQTWNKLMSSEAVPADAGVKPPAPGVMRIKYKNTGGDVLAIQQKLAALNYYASALDGYFSYTLYKAVCDFQKVNGLKVDGVVGQITWDQLMGPGAIPRP